jgi:pSer/pThr/pTyr-binding forkhead associated (FHA) protein
MPKLIYHDSDGIDRVLTLGSEQVLIGRAAECQVQTQDAMVSRRHARIVWDGNYWIEDLGSSNGVYIGHERITRAPFRPGDTVTCGSLILKLIPEAQPRQQIQDARSGAQTLPPPREGGEPKPQTQDAELASLSQLRLALEREGQRRERADAALVAAAERTREAERRVTELEPALREVDKLKRKVDQLMADLKRARPAEDQRTSAGADGEDTRDDRDRMARIAAETERDRLQRRCDELEHALAEERTAVPSVSDPQAMADLRDALKRVEGERDVARRQAAEVRSSVGQKATNTQIAGEAAVGILDSLAELRASLRVATDEAALLTSPSQSVQVIGDALAGATAQLEAARAAVRELTRLLGLVSST